jgi:hypothetical protein
MLMNGWCTWSCDAHVDAIMQGKHLGCYRFDLRSYIQPLGLYKDPCTPLKHQVIKIFSWRSIHLEPTLVPQSFSRLELRLVRLDLEGDQAMLGFSMLARAWFGISLVLYSISLFHWDCIIATMFISTLSFISFMSLKAMFIICSSFVFGVARLWKPCIRSYSAHPIGPWVSDRHYLSVVLRYLFIYGCPYMPGCVVDRVGDSCVESFSSPIYIDVGSERIKMPKRREWIGLF